MMRPSNRGAMGMDPFNARGPFNPPVFTQTIKLKSVLKGSKEKYQIINPNHVEKNVKRPMSCGGIRTKTSSFREEKFKDSTTALNSNNNMNLSLMNSNLPIQLPNNQPPSSNSANMRGLKHLRNNYFSGPDDKADKQVENKENSQGPSQPLGSSFKMPPRSTPSQKQTDIMSNTNKMFSRRLMNNTSSYNSMISRNPLKPSDKNLTNMGAFTLTQNNIGLQGVDKKAKRPKTADTEPLKKEKKKRLGINSSDRRILSKVNTNSVSLRGSSPHFRYFYR
mmetsp:Transcript_4194/g.8492  ORF Transcript_4194/g.8492 Transcript_4194/m.8492 type:complete len:278 (+) Transcript_4194:693-1526(+)